jgi:hypothetical protein
MYSTTSAILYIFFYEGLLIQHDLPLLAPLVQYCTMYIVPSTRYFRNRNGHKIMHIFKLFSKYKNSQVKAAPKKCSHFSALAKVYAIRFGEKSLDPHAKPLRVWLEPTEYTECQAFSPDVRIGSPLSLTRKRVLPPTVGSRGEEN